MLRHVTFWTAATPPVGYHYARSVTVYGSSYDTPSRLQVRGYSHAAHVGVRGYDISRELGLENICDVYRLVHAPLSRKMAGTPVF